MRNIRRILVAVKDPNAKSLSAVAKAAQLARGWDAELELFYGVGTTRSNLLSSQDPSLVGDQPELHTEILRPLEVIAARLRKHGIKVTVSAACDLPVDEAIMRRARRVKADLIVAECHAGQCVAPGPPVLMDWTLLQKSRIPILLIKSARPYRHPIVLAAINPMHAFSKPTRLDEEVLRNSARLQRALRGTLHTVHAYLPQLPLAGGGVDAHAKKGFERALHMTRIPHARCHLIEQPAPQAIAHVARETGSAIVVMGAVSRSGMLRACVGNTAEGVVNDVTCDVLVVKPRGFKSAVLRASLGVRLMARAAAVA
jgi:universal stress protein E